MAPLLPERERYLTYLFEIGSSRENVRSIASMLLQVVQVLKLDSARPVGMDEILSGCERRVEDSNACRHRRPGMNSRHSFQRVATNWLRFRGALITSPKPVPKFDNILSEFLNAMRAHGLALETLQSYRMRILMFLNWLQTRCSEFSDVRALDIEEFLEAKRSHGWSRYTRQIVASVGRVGIIVSVSSFDRSAVDRPVSFANRDSVRPFCIRRARSFAPIE